MAWITKNKKFRNTGIAERATVLLNGTAETKQIKSTDHNELVEFMNKYSMKMKLPNRICKRCGHGSNPEKPWYLRKETEPRICPKCKSPYWNIDKKPKEKVIK